MGANLTGIVISSMPEKDEALVMWSNEDRSVTFLWHLQHALLVVGPENMAEVRSRCNLDS